MTDNEREQRVTDALYEASNLHRESWGKFAKVAIAACNATLEFSDKAREEAALALWGETNFDETYCEKLISIVLESLLTTMRRGAK